MVIYVYPTPENKYQYYELLNPRPIPRNKIHFVSPNSPNK